MGTTVSVPCGLTRTTEAFTASWPSRKTVAETVKASSTTDLAGRAPQSTSGRTFWTGMRPIGSCGGEVRGAVLGTVRAAGRFWGRAPALLESGGVGVVARGVAVTRPTLLGLALIARLCPLKDRTLKLL